MHALIKENKQSPINSAFLVGPCNDAQSNISVPEENGVKTGKPSVDRFREVGMTSGSYLTVEVCMVWQ